MVISGQQVIILHAFRIWVFFFASWQIYFRHGTFGLFVFFSSWICDLSRNKTIAPNLFCMARTACDWSLYFTISLMVNLGFHWAWVYHLVRTSRQTVDIKATPSVPLWKLGFHWAWEVKHFLFWPKYIKRLLIFIVHNKYH